MPSASEKQRNYIFYLRNKFGSKEKTPEKDKWIWNSEWEKIESIRKEEVQNIELLAGAEIEKEHYNTYCMIKEYFEKTGELISEEDLYQSIAIDHINESENKKNTLYYSMLSIMENLMELGITREDIINKFGLVRRDK